ncbi:MAG: hypothetical protein H7123_09015 [Thermoleophilia bacterium]|nr:hypothetical protein [Thermoleophilia bacterium]
MKKLLALLLVIATGAGFYVWNGKQDKGTAISVNKVARDAKSKGGDSLRDSGLRPGPGTYAYSGEGGDHITILKGASHIFPAKMAGVVTLKKGCNWNIDFTYLKEKTKQRRMCTDKTGARETGSDEVITFLGLTDKQHFTCPDDAWRIKFTAKVGDTWSFTCKTKDREVKHVVTVVDYQPNVQMFNEAKPGMWHTHDVSTLTGASVGTDTTDFWWSGAGLPRQISETTNISTESVLGKTDYTVHAKYKLSAAPV